MKYSYSHIANLNLWCLITVISLAVNALTASGQGTITFDAHANLSTINYIEQGVQLSLVMPTPGNHDGMGISPAITYPWNTPYNSTPYMLFFQQFSPDDYVNFSLTSGGTFGLASVQLADPNSPSLSPVAILFKGYKSGGVTVTQTFTTPGNGATTFQNYMFNSTFSSGLTSVDILATRWAMDNLVVVPEPSTLGLLSLGGLILGWRWRNAGRVK